MVAAVQGIRVKVMYGDEDLAMIAVNASSEECLEIAEKMKQAVASSVNKTAFENIGIGGDKRALPLLYS